MTGEIPLPFRKVISPEYPYCQKLQKHTRFDPLKEYGHPTVSCTVGALPKPILFAEFHPHEAKERLYNLKRPSKPIRKHYHRPPHTNFSISAD